MYSLYDGSAGEFETSILPAFRLYKVGLVCYSNRWNTRQACRVIRLNPAYNATVIIHGYYCRVQQVTPLNNNNNSMVYRYENNASFVTKERLLAHVLPIFCLPAEVTIKAIVRIVTVNDIVWTRKFNIRSYMLINFFFIKIMIIVVKR